MNYLELLNQCRALSIRLTLKQGKLVVSDKDKKMTPQLKQGLQDNKADIVAWLAQAMEKAAQQASDQNSADSSVQVKAQSTLKVAPVAEIYPLSFAQQRLWFIDQLTEQGAHYNVPLGLRVKGPFNSALMVPVLQHIFSRHQVLRTVFKMQGNDPVQQVYPLDRMTRMAADLMNTVDLTALPEPQRTVQLNEVLKTEFSRSFELSQDLMMRSTLVQLADNDIALLFVIHHIACDGWSLPLLMKEFMVIYQALSQGLTIPLPALDIQYTDYAVWQRDTLSNQFGTTQQYWQQQLAGVPLLHQVPLDMARPTQPSGVGRILNVSVNEVLSRQLNQLAKRHDASLFMVLQSAFAVLLGRWSGQQDIVMGIPIAGRTHSQLEPIIGFFINTLVFRTDLSGGQSFVELLQQARQTALDAYEHQAMPFDMLVEQLVPQRTLNYSPLCQITFTMQNNDGAAVNSAIGTTEVGDLAISSLSTGIEVSKFDIELSASENRGKIELIWRYSADLFNPATIESIGQNFTLLLEGIAADPSQRLEQFSLLSEPQIADLYRLGQGIADQQGRTIPLIGQIQQVVEDRPQAIALSMGECQLSFAQLNNQANRLADYLVDEDIGQGDRVGILIERSPAMMVAMLAVMKSGAAYVPMDINNTVERLAHTIKDAEIELVLTSREAMASLPIGDIDVVMIDDACESHWLADYNEQNPSQLPELTDTAYIIYTSGSTGKPKGVVVSHLGLTDYCAFALKHYYYSNNSENMNAGQTPLNGSLVATAHSFDLTIASLYVPLLGGGTVDLLDHEDNISGLAERLDQPSCGHFLLRLTPMHVKGLLTLMTHQQMPQQHVFVVGGERFSAELATQLQNHFPKSRVFNHYGPSETVVGCCIYDYTSNINSGGSGLQLPIGKPMANTQLLVLDQRQKLVPQGMVGELVIGGICVAKGYNNLAEMTAKVFIDNPFSGSGQKLYRSGDMVRWLPSGNLEYIGRVDEQVKIRGYRIELGEIERLISAHAQVKDQKVMVFGDDDNKRLVAYVVPNLSVYDDAGRNSLMMTVKQQLAAQLPDYMQPSCYLPLSALPLNANGKLDKTALPSPDMLDGQSEYVVPATVTEQVLVQIWATLLKLDGDKISTTGHFFELGGHSLLSVRLVGEIRRQLAVELTVKRIFEAPVLSQLACLIDQQSVANAVDGAQLVDLTISAEPRDGLPLPLSFSQQSLWFMDQLQGGSAEYNMPFAFKVEGQLDLTAVRDVISAIIGHHEILRTVYLATDKGAVQQVNHDFNFTLAVHDLTALAGVNVVEQQAKLGHLIDADAAKTFDLSQDLMIRASYILLQQHSQQHSQQQQGVLLFNIHHIASDGWSMDLLTRAFFQGYAVYVDGGAAALATLFPEPKLQYGDYARWQRNLLQGEVLDGQLAYWIAKLEGATAVHGLPLDHPRGQINHHLGGVVSGRLSGDQARALQVLAKHHQLTDFMLLHGALSLVLSRHSNSHDIVIGTPVANRMQPELASLIGFFTNTLVLRVDTDHQYLGGYLAHVRDTHLDAQSHQQVPFDLLVDKLGINRSASCSPVFQIILTTSSDYGLADDHQPQNMKLAGLNLHVLSTDVVTAKFDLDINIQLNDNGVRLKWIYNKDLFSAEHIEQLNRHLCRVLSSLAQIMVVEQCSLKDVVMLSETEQDQLLYQLNQPLQQTLETRCLHQLFEEKVRQYPNNIALIGPDQAEQLTYAELNTRANQVAHYLVEHRLVTPDTLVGLCVERSIVMVIGLLAILKAGGAYVPIDPGCPPARFDYILQDADLSLVLSESAVQAKVDFGARRCIALDCEDFSHYQRDDIDPALLGLSTEHLAYVIYTSGSTGKPKGVLQNHQNIYRLLAVTEPDFGFDCDDVWTLFHSIAFDFSVWELWGALAYGGKLVIVDVDNSRDTEAFVGLCATQKVTILNQTPSAFNAFSAEVLQQNLRLPALRKVVFGGEALQLENLMPWWQRFGDQQVELINMYGITETTVHVSYKSLSMADVGVRGSSTIGHRLSDQALYLLDKNLQPVPYGTVGEVYVGGAGLARGYLGQPQLTAQRFIDNPHATEQMRQQGHDRLYKTGDLARFMANGELEYKGREDHQVKIRGFRIELDEITGALLKHPDISDAVVLVKTQAQDQAQHIVAYVQTVLSLEIDALRQFLKQWLPDHMLPAAFVLLARFPLTINGKIDHKALPEPDMTEQSGVSYVAPQTPQARVLCEVWQQVLGLPLVGVYDNFFSIGGDSIKVVLIVRLAQQQGLDINVRDVFAHQNVAGIVEQFTTDGGGLAARLASSLAPVPLHLLDSHLAAVKPDLAELLARPEVEDCYPVSAAQHGMLLAHQDPQGEVGVYHTQSVYDLEIDGLSVARLRKVWKDLITKHPVLRTRFIAVAEGFVQLVLKPTSFNLPVVDISDASSAQQDLQIQQLIAADLAQPFGYGIDESALRVTLIRLSPLRWSLFMAMHHAIEDGWGVVELLKALVSGYLQPDSASDIGGPLSQVNVFKAHVALELEAAQSEQYREVWRNLLSDFKPLPKLKPHGLDLIAKDVSAAKIEFGLSDQQSQRLQVIAKTQQVPFKALLLLAYQYALADLLQTDIVTVDLVTSGRSSRLPDALNGLGLFWSFLPLCSALCHETATDLQQLSAKLLTIDGHSLYPISAIKQTIDPSFESALSSYIAFNYVNFHNVRQVSEQESGNTAGSNKSIDNEIKVQHRHGRDRFHHAIQLTLAGQQDSGEILAFIQYDRRYFNGSTMDQLKQVFLRQLDIMAQEL